MNPRQNTPGPNSAPGGQVQIPTIPAHALKRFKAQFVFDAEGGPGGEAVVAAKDLAGALGIVLAQLHPVALPLKAVSITLIDPPLILSPNFAAS